MCIRTAVFLNSQTYTQACTHKPRNITKPNQHRPLPRICELRGSKQQRSTWQQQQQQQQPCELHRPSELLLRLPRAHSRRRRRSRLPDHPQTTTNSPTTTVRARRSSVAGSGRSASRRRMDELEPRENAGTILAGEMAQCGGESGGGSERARRGAAAICAEETVAGGGEAGGRWQ